MDILIFSDSHGQVQPMMEIIKKTDFDILIHLGDHTRDAQQLSQEIKQPIEYVRGNCDYNDTSSLDEKILEVAGKKIFICHGHAYNVKNTMDKIYYRGLEMGVDLVLFGHSHMTYLEKDEKLILFNPGSISLPKMGNVGTYGLVRIENNEITINVKKL